jgi:hypothetical protein
MNMNKLMISNRVLESIKTHLEVSAPYVAGGFLFSNTPSDTKNTEVNDVKPTLNVVEGIPNQFHYSLEEYTIEQLLASEKAQSIIGFYASVYTKEYDLAHLFLNSSAINTYYLVGVIQGNELVGIDTYVKQKDEFIRCSVVVSEATEVL